MISQTDFLQRVASESFEWCLSPKRDYVCNIPCAFDIETSSFYDDEGNKVGIMYQWTFGLGNNDNYIITYGRTWDELRNLLGFISALLRLDERRQLYCYVHNLSFEFQFLRTQLRFTDVFAVDERKPVYAKTDLGIVFKCSYILSNMSLAEVANNLTAHKAQKLVGDLDYSKIRTSDTALTDTELKYCEYDVLIDLYFIAEEIDNNAGDITKIPLTKTGYVRRYTRDMCLHNGDKTHKKTDGQYRKYRQLMQELTLTPADYKILRRAYMGGFTHCNAFCSNKVMQDVTSYDFTSSYPAVMISEQYPMSKGRWVKVESAEQLKHYLKYYCCVFDIRFNRLQLKLWCETPISASKCWDESGVVEDNGRVVRADYICTTITEQDFEVYKQFYEWESIEIINFVIFEKAYLPKPIIESILTFYSKKTTLKGVDGQEVNYLVFKGMLNAIYGMMACDICRDVNEYDGKFRCWTHGETDIESDVEKANKSGNRFLYYAWGIWVTAYARRNLFDGIINTAADYIYSDTDSIKITHAERYAAYFDSYNKKVLSKVKRCCDYYGLDFELCRPCSIDGEQKPIGVWDFDGHYRAFKSLGAKRYLTLDDKGVHKMTVAGLPKKSGLNYILKYVNPFTQFTDDFEVPAEHTGKLTHTYIDEPRSGTVVDYTGQLRSYSEGSAVHLEPCEFSLKLSSKYANYLLSIQEVER